MAGDFHQIFPSIGFWVWPRSYDNFVEGNLIMMKFEGSRCSGLETGLAQLFGNWKGLRSADSEHCEGGDPWGGGTSRDGIFFERHSWQHFRKFRRPRASPSYRVRPHRRGWSRKAWGGMKEVWELEMRCSW